MTDSTLLEPDVTTSYRTTVLATVFTLTGACVVWLYGIVVGRLFLLLPVYEICGFDRTQDYTYDSSWFPLRSVCSLRGGGRTDLVPGFVNPLIFALLVAAVFFTVRAVLIRRRMRAGDS